MSDRDDYIYPEQVCYEIADANHDSYGLAATHINRHGYDILSVQHEYGIFGGEAGSYLMSLVREAKMPIVTTLHTVLQKPSFAQKEVLDELLQLSERVVVMSKKAVGFLVDIHDVQVEKIDLIPHGIPMIEANPKGDFRASLKIDGPMILTFGLLSPDKGIQFVIEAMPQIVQAHPGAIYVVVGATHPHVRASAGEVYRESLVKLAADLGVSDSVRFVDRFVTLEELVEYLAAMDIYVTPYLNPQQITSGTLAYSIGAGKAVISTPYWYAEELLADGRGVLVPFRDADAIADAVSAIQSEPESRLEMGRRAAEYGQNMLWPEVGRSYLSTFNRAKRESAERLRVIVGAPRIEVTAPLPDLHLNHLFDLSDDTGILQHATFSIPNRSEGYCVDDNARALLLTTYLDSPEVALLQSRYLSFVMDSFNPTNGRFRNFMSYRREWLEEAGSEDSHGRSLWALGATANRSRDRGRREVAKQLFERGAPAMINTTSPRAWAYSIFGAAEYLHAFPHESSGRDLMQNMSGRLMERFETNHADNWPWPEDSLSYANARLPQALIIVGEQLDHRAMTEMGLKSLSWLMSLQTGAGGVFVPIGANGFFIRGEDRAVFDQQPVEAAASVSACLSAFRFTGRTCWLDEAHRSFRWFIGENMLGQSLYDPSTGGCCDGLHPKRLNRNQGAESTLSFLCSLAELSDPMVRPVSAEQEVNAFEVK